MNRTIRFFLAAIVLTISLTLLAWSFWPMARETHILNLDSTELVLPTAQP